MFFLIGDWIRTHKVQNIVIAVCFVCWVISIAYSRIWMVQCHYELYPIDILGACGGTAFIYWVSKNCSKTKLNTVFVWLGVNSLVILCFHLIELNCKLCDRLHVPGVFYYQFPVKFAFCVMMTWLCYKFKFTRNVFGLK
jgi:fucose 4-O-acetylase-like acetyltransferase